MFFLSQLLLVLSAYICASCPPDISHIFRKCMFMLRFNIIIYFSLVAFSLLFASNRYTHLCRSLLILLASTKKKHRRANEKSSN
jgi:hypothetical protein